MARLILSAVTKRNGNEIWGVISVSTDASGSPVIGLKRQAFRIGMYQDSEEPAKISFQVPTTIQEMGPGIYRLSHADTGVVNGGVCIRVQKPIVRSTAGQIVVRLES